MTHSCALCEDEFHSDQDRIRVGKSYICESCCESGIKDSMDEMAMWLNQVFDKATVEVAKAA